MRHFAHLTDAERDELFVVPPRPFDAASPASILGPALGAVLYTPAHRAGLADAILGGRFGGLTTMVLCLEDAVADDELAGAEAGCMSLLQRLAAAADEQRPGHENIPLLFLRVRSPEHLTALLPRILEHVGVLAGFSLPKFNAARGARFLEILHNAPTHRHLWAMPILESQEIIHRESRLDELLQVLQVVEEHRDRVLCLRIGGTDLSGLFGLRRSSDHTLYDLAVVRDCIADIVNVFGRASRGHTISGPVWEYFAPDRRLLKPQLRLTPFRDEAGPWGEMLREVIIDRALDGLLREVLLDAANGLVGKTVIHPSHVAPVHALTTVTEEEYSDAQQILASPGGAFRSASGERMNEAGPHAAWAQRVLARAQTYGVLRQGHNYVSLLEATAMVARV